MNKLSIVLLSLVAVMGGGLAHAQAQSTSHTGVPNMLAQPQMPPQTARPVIKPGDRNCIRDTGSLIKAPKGKCLPVAGRSYGQGDLRKTGEPTLGPALEKLDPSISTGGR